MIWDSAEHRIKAVIVIFGSAVHSLSGVVHGGRKLTGSIKVSESHGSLEVGSDLIEYTLNTGNEIHGP